MVEPERTVHRWAGSCVTRAGPPPATYAGRVEPAAQRTARGTHAADLGPVGADETRDPVDYSDPNVVLDAHEDRWAWRRRLRDNPRTHAFYRIAVAVVGTLLILLAAATGWLPGPGGIPLAIAGLAVLASEFEWAQRLLHPIEVRWKRFLRWSGRQPAWLKVTGSVCTLAVVLAVVWLGLVLTGLPGWLPDAAASLLVRVPGL